MNKQDFLTKLEHALAGIPHSERQKTIDYYREYIEDCIEDGAGEEETVNSLESVEVIAEKIINETPIRKFVSESVKSKKYGYLKIVLIIMGAPVWVPLLIALFSVVVSLYLSAWSVIFSLFATSLGLTVGGIGGALLSFVFIGKNVLSTLFMLGAGLICAGIGILIFVLAIEFSKLFVEFTKQTVRGIKSVFIKGGIDNV